MFLFTPPKTISHRTFQISGEAFERRGPALERALTELRVFLYQGAQTAVVEQFWFWAFRVGLLFRA